MSGRPEVAIVGAGVVGLSLACELARRGRRVLLVEAGEPGGGATRAAGGILSPTDPHEWRGELGALNRRALALWPAWAAALGRGGSAGHPLWRPAPELRIAWEEHDRDWLAAAADGAARWGLEQRPLDWEGCRRLAPALAAGGRAGLRLDGLASVEPGALVDALVATARARGVRLVGGRPVRAAELAGGALALAEVAGGRPAPVTVLACGAWLGGEALPVALRRPVRPVLGEGVIVRPREAWPAGAPVVRTPRGSIVPRHDGTVWIGTTVEEVGFAAHPRAGAVARIIATAAGPLPQVAEAEFVGAVAGLRPVAAGGLPFVHRPARGPLAVGGHGREGIIQAPAVALAVADGLTRGDWAGVPASMRSGDGW